MVVCAECEKKLHFYEGYRHPALGTQFLVCGSCFDKVTDDMERWSRFCSSSSFPHDSTIREIQDAWTVKLSPDHVLQQWFVNLWEKIRAQDLQQIQKKGSSMRVLSWAFRQ